MVAVRWLSTRSGTKTEATSGCGAAASDTELVKTEAASGCGAYEAFDKAEAASGCGAVAAFDTEQTL